MRRLSAALISLATWALLATSGAAQPPPAPMPAPTPAPGSPGGPGSAGGPILQPPVLGTDIGIRAPGVLFPPLTGLDPLYPAPAQGPLTFTPSITIAEEFNDNVFLDNNNKRSDFITQISPGLALAMQQPGFTLNASYALTAEIYARESEFSGINSHRFFAGLTYQMTPRLGLNLADGFTYSEYSNAASVAGVSTGRQTSFSNVLSAGLSFQATQRLTWDVSGAYTIQRFDSSDSEDFAQRSDSSGSQDSDTYQIGTGLGYVLTPRLTVNGRYDFQYLDFDGERPSTTHTPRVGASYQFSPTLTVSASAGPSFLVEDGETTVRPAVSASIAKTTSWGFLSAFYDRSFGTAGGFGGPADGQTFGGTVAVATYLRGLFASFSPRYTMTKEVGSSASKTDVNALTLNLSASYQLARYVAIVGAYTFFHQTTEGDIRGADVDQNRISVGLRFGYPINFY